MRLHLGMQQLDVILADGRRQAPRRPVLEPVDQLLDHQGRRQPVVGLHSIPIARVAGNDRDRTPVVRVPHSESVPVLPLRAVPCEF